MFGLFKRNKLVTVPTPTIDAQLKSLSFPASQPRWKLNDTGVHNWNVQTAITEGFQASSILYACVEKRAKLIASVPWCAAKKMPDGTIEKVYDSPLQRLIDRPNIDQSWYELMYNASQSLDLAGHTFISKLRAGISDQPKELWILPAKNMKIKPGSIRLVDNYKYMNKHIILSTDMVMLKMPNPDSQIFGMPVLMAAGRATDVDREAGIWQKVSLQNRGAADINIKLPPEATQDQVDQAKAAYAEQQSGPTNARKALISNADIQQLGQTAVELDFVASRRTVWTEICAAFGLSLSNLGMTEDVNLANADAMDRALWLNTIIPQLELMQRQLTHQLARDFGDEWVLLYDVTNVKALQQSLTLKLDDAKKLHSLGVPFDLISKKLELGIEEIVGGDVGYIASGLIPVSFNIDEPRPPTDPDAEV
jgi:HK97 family phage portal protein